MKIEGASALVAGGASGLGAATVRALHERGASVVIADLNAEKGEALGDGRFEALPCGSGTALSWCSDLLRDGDSLASRLVRLG